MCVCVFVSYVTFFEEVQNNVECCAGRARRQSRRSANIYIYIYIYILIYLSIYTYIIYTNI